MKLGKVCGLGKEKIFEIIQQVQNPYPLDLVAESDAIKLAKKLKKILKENYRIVECLLWVWGNYVFELAKKDIEKAIEDAFEEK